MALGDILRSNILTGANLVAVSLVVEPFTSPRCHRAAFTRGLLATGRFIAAMPLSLLRFAPQRNTVVELATKVTTDLTRSVVTLRNRTFSAGARLFIEKTRDVTAPLRKHTR